MNKPVSFEERSRLFAGRFTELARMVLLRRIGMLRLILLAIAAIVSGLIVWQFLFTKPEDAATQPALSSQRLNVSVVDDLELWIEERQSAYEHPPVIPDGVLGR